MENKFKVGDRVRCSRDSGYSFVPCEGTIVWKHLGSFYVHVDNLHGPGKRDSWLFKSDHLTPVAPATNNTMKVVITSDGKTTLARLYDGNKVVQRAEAVCSPDDKFDFSVGAKLAMERLMGNDEKKPTYFSGKVVCVEKKEHRAYTVGKVYEFKDGFVTIDNGNTLPHKPVATLEEFNDFGFAVGAKFIPLVE